MRRDATRYICSGRDMIAQWGTMKWMYQWWGRFKGFVVFNRCEISSRTGGAALCFHLLGKCVEAHGSSSLGGGCAHRAVRCGSAPYQVLAVGIRTGEVSSRPARLGHCRTPTNGCLTRGVVSQAAFSKVRHWTRNVDIFTKKFVIVPVVSDMHWSVAVLANLNTLKVIGSGVACADG